MKVTDKKKNGVITVKIEGDAVISTAVELKKALSAYVNLDCGIELDLSGVENIDTAAYQLIRMMGKTIKDKNKDFKIIKYSPNTQSLFTLYGDSRK